MSTYHRWKFRILLAALVALFLLNAHVVELRQGRLAYTTVWSLD